MERMWHAYQKSSNHDTAAARECRCLKEPSMLSQVVQGGPFQTLCANIPNWQLKLILNEKYCLTCILLLAFSALHYMVLLLL